MQNQLNIPPKIKVGYQERADTYTKRLAYVIYYDNKGVLRKETSWQGWIDKGHDGFIGWDYENKDPIHGGATRKINPDLIRGPLPTHDYDNVPTEGFVLNKKAGGYSSGWNHRATYCRVFDPRGFEFEISIENLLFILQESTSSKGKGLEGEFVYSWSGKDLVLLPCSCEEYQKSKIFTGLKNKKVASKDLIVGGSYETKKQETIIYLGRFPYYSFSDLRKNKERMYGSYITSPYNAYFFKTDNGIEALNSLATLATCLNDTPVSNYAELMEELSKNHFLSSPVSFDGTREEIDLTNLTYLTNQYYLKFNLYRKITDTRFVQYNIRVVDEWQAGILLPDGSHTRSVQVLKGYNLIPSSIISIENGLITILNENLEGYKFESSKKTNYWQSHYELTLFSKEELIAKNYKKLFVILANGTEIEFQKYKK